MANTPINELDFFAVKEQLKTYLKSQTKLKDYDFEGSNISVLLDVLSYNTFQNNFYTNMAINEMFLDSATLENSIVSHAKELNYLPRSAVSAKAVVKVTFTESSTAQTILIPKYTRFSTNYQGENYQFITEKAYLARKINAISNVYVANNVEIYEGAILNDFEKEGFFIDENNNLKCNLTNDNIDISTVEVFVDEASVGEENAYIYKKDIFGVRPNDKVFYIEPYFDGRYSIVFGRNIFGDQPDFDIDIKIRYRICNGSASNGASIFSTNFKQNTTVEVIERASGGAEKESLESIKFFAPRSIQIQERAVTANDYEVLLKQKFTYIKSISVYGGDELDPPQFGKVGISVNLEGNALLSETSKSEFLNYISDKSPLTIKPIFIDPEFLYGDLSVTIFYSPRLTDKSEEQLESEIRSIILAYSRDTLDDFGAAIRVSKLSSLIDNTDTAILSNKIIARPVIEYSPRLNVSLNPTFRFDTKLVKPYPFKQVNGFSDYKPAIKSSVFSYTNICSVLQDDGAGNVQIISSDALDPQILNSSIGTIDYNSGEIRLVGFKVDSFAGSAIKIFAQTELSDIVSPKNRVLLIRDSDVVINMVESQ